MSKNQTNKEGGLNVGEVYTRTELFLEKNRKSIFIVLGGAVALFVGYFAFQYLYSKPREEKAEAAIWKAEQYFEIDSLNWAKDGNGEYEGFEAIAANYSGTKAAKRAHYYLGIIYRDKGEFQAALDHFKEADLEDETISTICVGNIGDMYVQLGNYEEGASYLEKAARKAANDKGRNYLAPVYMIKAAKVYMELSKDDKAIGLLQSVTEDYDKNTQDYNEAAKLLAMLRARKG